jgi:galactose mutarotase-like enzyme
LKEITLTNRDLKVVILPYGGIIKELWYKDTNVVLGKKNAHEYLDNPWHMGVCIGRYAGRLTSEYTIYQDRYTHKKSQPFSFMEENMDGTKLFGKYMICTMELFRMLF